MEKAPEGGNLAGAQMLTAGLSLVRRGAFGTYARRSDSGQLHQSSQIDNYEESCYAPAIN